MRRRRWLLIAVASVASILLVWTFGGDRFSSDKSRDPIIVRVDGYPHRLSEFRRFRRESLVFWSESQALQELERFVMHVILEERAARASAEAGRKVDIGGFLAREIEGKVAADRPSSEEIESYYEEHLDEFVHPRQARIAYFRVLPEADPEHAARALYVRAQMSSRLSDFRRELSRARPGVRSAEIGPVRCDSAGVPDLPAAAIRVACRLNTREMAPPFEVDGEWFVVRKMWEQPARKAPLKLVRGEIRDRLVHERRTRAHEQLLREFREQADVDVNVDVVRSLVHELQQRPRDHRRPAGPPGYSARVREGGGA